MTDTIFEPDRSLRFHSAISTANISNLGGLPNIALSWVFLVDMVDVMTSKKCVSYLSGEDEVRIRD